MIQLVHLFYLSNLSNLMGRLRYVEQELAKKRGKNTDAENQVENDVKRAEDELYKIPEHLKVSDDLLYCIMLFSFCKPSTHSLLTYTPIYIIMLCGFWMFSACECL